MYWLKYGCNLCCQYGCQKGYCLKIKNIEQQDNEAFIYILEVFNEKVEKEFNEKKIGYLKNYFKKTLMHPVSRTNFNERKFFLDALDSMTIIEIEILGFLFNKNDKIQLKEISLPYDIYVIVGGVERLKSYGFLESITVAFQIGNGIDNRLIEKLNLSEFAIKFYKFCIE
ncbi:MAG: hypothetical protein FJW69_08385 [Actinobacteria bacterium]|nr:hypothetical protein [Actinomycetota bacterium]